MTDRTEQSRNVPGRDGERPRGLRMLTESLVFLALAVTVFRWSAVEGFMISTGSMATSLFGYHRRVTCPVCGFEFAVGAPGPRHFAAAPRPGLILAEQSVVGDAAGRDTASCPNCDLSGIDLSKLPLTEGDQILVHKDAFLWRELLHGEGPRRWEVAVFRNPEDPTLTYVKRVVGLPGESMELIAGDVYADGRLQRKPFTSQLATRTLIHDSDFEPAGDPGPDWKPRWLIDGRDSPWEWNAPAFEMHAPAGDEASDYHWVGYEHWIRRGGTHTTTVGLDAWPETVPRPDPLLSPVEYDAAERQVSCFGALPASVLNHWLTLSDDEDFRRALELLYHRSHNAPITDRMYYNVGLSRDPPALVTDFMLDLTLERATGDGVFAVELTDGVDVFAGEFDFEAGEVRLRIAGEDRPRVAGPLPPMMREEAVSIQMSTFDRQIVLAVNEQPILGPVELPPLSVPTGGVRSPARFGARRLDALVDHIRLYRDVHYSTGEASGKRLFTLGPDEYFVLGDNSSVSVDSRHWEHPGVARELLVGKPLLVHLPSRSRRLNWGDGRHYIRVPDLNRIRYIR